MVSGKDVVLHLLEKSARGALYRSIETAALACVVSRGRPPDHRNMRLKPAQKMGFSLWTTLRANTARAAGPHREFRLTPTRSTTPSSTRPFACAPFPSRISRRTPRPSTTSVGCPSTRAKTARAQTAGFPTCSPPPRCCAAAKSIERTAYRQVRLRAVVSTCFARG